VISLLLPVRIRRSPRSAAIMLDEAEVGLATCPGANPSRNTFGKVKKDWPLTKKSYCRKLGVCDSGGLACATILRM
jgi:hypothetical protein